MDFTQMPVSQGYKYLLVMIDTFTGWIEGFPTQNEKAEKVVAYQAPPQLTVSNPGPPVRPWLCLFMQCLTYSPLQTSSHCLPSCLKQETGPERDAPAQHFTASKGITSLRVLQLPLIEFKWAKEFITT